MRIAVVTDIHGNRHAMFAVLADLRRVGADEVVFGGDAALFGSRPRECWERVLDLGWRLVQGNTDRYIATLGPKLSSIGKPTGPPVGHMPINVAWAAARLGPDLVRRLGAMPRQASIESPAGTLLVVHGSPGDDETGWSRDDDEETVARVIGPTEAAAVVSGHTHTAMIRHAGNVLAVNCGAVGRSHDGQPGLATYAVLDDAGGRWSAELRRVDYDFRGAHAEVRSLGVPLTEAFASTLLTGISPA